MQLLRIFVVLVAVVACKGKSTEPGQGSQGSAPTTVENPDGVPSTVRLVPGGTLVTKREKGEVRIWIYNYPKGEPGALAEQQSKALQSAGWKTIVRKEADDKLPPPVYAVYGTRDGKLAVAQAYGGPAGGLELKLFLEPMHGLTLEPPADYPKGFPFLAFGIPYKPKTQTASQGTSIVYNGELAGIQAELAAATKAGGWDCPTTTAFAQLTLCKKDGKEVFVILSSLSANRQSLMVAIEKP